MLAAYDAELRAYVPPIPAEGETIERDGPVLRFMRDDGQGWVLYQHLGGLEGEALDALIARQVEVFAKRGQRFEWKHHTHDLPVDLPDRLRAAGFVPEDQETVVIGEVEGIAGPVVVPEGVRLREVTARPDLERIARMEGEVWGERHTDLVGFLASEIAADPESVRIVVAEAGDTVVCASWIRFPIGTDIATLWGGATLAAWRRKGIYRATVTYRANLAAARGFRYLQVDASDDSRPILERLGLVAVTTTTPYVWTPPTADMGPPS